MVRRDSRRRFLKLCAATASGFVLPHVVRAEPPSTAEKNQPALPRKKLIAWGWDTVNPEKIQNNIRKIEEMPFDGIVLSNFKARKGAEDVMFEWRCFGNERFEREQLASAIDTLKHIDFRKFTDNFLRFNVQPGDVDWFDDFDAILHNAHLWAEVAREVGAKGWKFDVEDYSDSLFVYHRQKYAAQKSFEEYAAQVQLRGRQVMEAIQAGYPEITLLLSLGQSYVNRTPNAKKLLAELPSYGLLPAFVNGIVEVVGPQVKLIDGQEQAYGYLTAEDYYRGYHDVRQGALALVPPELHAKYRAKMDVGMAVWANFQLAIPATRSAHWPAHYMEPADRVRLFEQNLYHALKTSDEYVWLYSEEMGWWEPGYPTPTPPGALEAIRNARTKFESGTTIGIDLTNAVAAAREKMEQATKAK